MISEPRPSASSDRIALRACRPLFFLHMGSAFRAMLENKVVGKESKNVSPAATGNTW
jgi:hypothetical protein